MNKLPARRIFLSVVLLVFLVSLTYFDSRKGNAAPAYPPAPGASPTPSASVSPLTWSSILWTVTNDALRPNDCDYPHRFEVRSDGSYTTGPCVLGDTTTIAQGQITDAELSKLSGLFDQLNQTDLSSPLICKAGGGAASTLEVIAGSPINPLGLDVRVDVQYILVDYSVGSVCYRGSKDAGQNLLGYIDQLTEEYYPTRNSQ